MLPDDFQWRPHTSTPTLWLGDVRIANYSSEPGRPYTLAYKAIGLREYSGRSFTSEAAARAYVEAWAVKWLPRIRQVYRGHAAG